MREEIDTTLFRMSLDLEKRLFEEFYSSARDTEELEEMKETAKEYFKTAFYSAYFRCKVKKR